MDFIWQGFLQALELISTGDPETYSAVWTTLRVSAYAMTAALLMGIPFGFVLGYFDFRGRRQLRLIVDTLLALPTVLVGLLVYAVISRQGPLGEMGLLFTIPGMALGLTILGLPVVTALSATAVESADRELRITLMSLGARRRQLLMTMLWEVRHGILAAALTALGRVMTEVGIAMMVGGNIKWYTRTMTTAIALETGRGLFATGVALGLILLAIAFAVNASVSFIRRR